MARTHRSIALAPKFTGAFDEVGDPIEVQEIVRTGTVRHAQGGMAKRSGHHASEYRTENIVHNKTARGARNRSTAAHLSRRAARARGKAALIRELRNS